MPVALSGAVIVSVSPFKYKKKCEYCGYLDGGVTMSAKPSKFSTMNASFVCPKCRKTVKIAIRGD